MAINSKQKGARFDCQYCGTSFFVPQYEINYRKTIKYCSSECYHKATRKPPEMRECLYCGRDIEITPRNPQKKFCNVECAYKYKREQKRVATLGADGYKRVWFADGSGEVEHRYIMEQHIGRKLERNEVVHHIDGNRANNDISNLVIMSRGEHSAIHRKAEIESGKKLFGSGKNGN